MEKLWNLSKTAVPMEKLWNFRFGGKKGVLSLRPDFEMFVASVITSLGLALTLTLLSESKKLPGYTASLGRVNTC